MASSSRSGVREDETQILPPTKATIQDRIAAFAMLDVMKDATQAEKAVRLSLVGFTAADIAAMLQTTTAVVYQSLYEARKRAGDKRPRRKATAAKGA